MKSAVYLDAQVLACPPPHLGLSIFSGYVENLIAWNDLKQADWLQIYISRYAASTLAESNAYPPFPDLQRAINVLDVKHMQAKDIVSLINSFLLKSFIIEDELGIDELLFKDCNYQPTIPLEQRQILFQEHFRLLSVLLSLHHHFISEVRNQVLITSMDGDYVGSTMISATITDLLKTSSEIIQDDIIFPLQVSVEFYLCRCLYSLHTSLDPCSIWANADCEFALKKAIEIYIFQSEPRQKPYKCPVSQNSYSIGPSFVRSCEQLGFFEDSSKIRMLLRACSETIIGTNTRAIHWIRTSIGGNSPQLKVGNNTAWRRDIDGEYHLHYWSTPHGPRLATVVRHNDFTIPID